MALAQIALALSDIYDQFPLASAAVNLKVIRPCFRENTLDIPGATGWAPEVALFHWQHCTTDSIFNHMIISDLR